MEIRLFFGMFKTKSVYLYYRFSISKRQRKVKRGFRKDRCKKLNCNRKGELFRVMKAGVFQAQMFLEEIWDKVEQGLKIFGRDERNKMTMEMETLYRLIDLQPEVVCRLRAVGEALEPALVEPYLERLTQRRTAAEAYRELSAFLAEDKDNMKMLYCQLACAGRVFDRYRQKGIAESIYIDTMKCFTRFLEECRQKNGRLFFDRGWWTYRQISMSLFRIGALEYEFSEEEGEKAIALHIPSDADLSAEAVDRSMQEADTFFRTCYPDYVYDRYTCESWLLSPVLRQLLPEQSHIVSFQKRFTIKSVDREENEYIEWLFQVPADTAYEQLPVRTSLQRKVRALLLDGGTVGGAYGISPRSGDADRTDRFRRQRDTDDLAVHADCTGDVCLAPV